MILRTFVLVAALLTLTEALAGTWVDATNWPMVLAIGILVAGILLERARYGAIRARPTSGAWRETSERFIDDESGRSIVVWYNDATGERRYVDIDEA